ncbi:MAG: type II/IV secretion system ATPase subunit [Thermofilaceae archaeon]
MSALKGLFRKKNALTGAQIELKFKAEPLVAVFKGDVKEKYVVDQALVLIVDEDGKGFYLISEPELTLEEQRVYSLLMENLYFSMRPVTRIEDPMKYVEGFIWDAAEELGIVERVEKSFQKYRYYIMRDAFGYGPIQIPMMDPDVEEISCTGYGRPVTVIHRRYTEYDWLDTNIVFQSEDSLKSFVQRMAQRVGKSLTTAIPFADAMSREGHRVAMTFGDEVTLPGSTFAVRKFPEEPLSMAHLLKFNTLTPLMASYLWLIMEYRGFIMVLGPMASGKTTMMNAILTTINPTLKIASIEDTPELRLPHPSWQRFKSRYAYSITESKFDIDLFDLVRLSLRYRPDYIVVGEVRGEEIRALIQAASLGHGCACTFHAEDPQAALVRMRSPPMSVPDGNIMLISCFVLLNRVKTQEGRVVRRVLEVTEVEPRDGTIGLRRIFNWDARTDTFTPSTAKEVVEKSIRLNAVMRLTGWSKSELIAEMEERSRFLQNIVDEGKLRYPEFSEEIRKFYITRRR